MRLLIALPDLSIALSIQNLLDGEGWDAEWIADSDGVLDALETESYHVALLHECLPGCGGGAAGQALAERKLICPPRIVYICPPEFYHVRPAWADVVLSPGLCASKLCDMVRIIAQKPLPKLAAARNMQINRAVEGFLNDIGLHARYKGRMYTAWLLQRIIPSPAFQQLPLSMLYAECADFFSTTPSAVERCTRIAVESVFTLGSLSGIERFFGATVDPERGKPTNRAFLFQSAQQLRTALRYSLAETGSPNRSVMHQSPAAPTSV